MSGLFTFYSLFLGGLFILALPVIIHLINLMRYRRVEWAAMEFLLAAYKKSRTWVLMKQFLLLLLRIAALLALLMILARFRYGSNLSEIVSGTTTHHILVVDDTFSMSDESFGEGTALKTATDEALEIGKAISKAAGQHWLSLMTYSGASRGTYLIDRKDAPKRVDSMIHMIKPELDNVQPTEMSFSPQTALETIERLEGGDKRRIYILSDFRKRDWGASSDLTSRFEEWSKKNTEVFLVQCAKTEHDNLTVTSLSPRNGALVAGVSVVMDVQIKNHGKTDRENVSLLRKIDGRDAKSFIIPKVEAGKTVKHELQVQFSRPGVHNVSVEISGKDSIAADNVRHTSIEIQEGIPVLIVDGLLAQGETYSTDSLFLSFSLKPTESQDQEGYTGILPEVVAPDFLSRPGRDLSRYQGIFVCNFDRLSDNAITALETYVTGGGGVAFFMGKEINPRFVNTKLYRGGEGLFPVPLAVQEKLIDDRIDGPPDVTPTDPGHPVFSIFEKVSFFLKAVTVSDYYAVAPDWQPDERSTVKVIARLRNDAPLAVEQQFNNGGRVLAFMTTAGTDWNNWARTPSYLVAIQELRNYIAPAFIDTSHRVGAKIAESLSVDEFEDKYQWATPNGVERGTLEINQKKKKQSKAGGAADDSADNDKDASDVDSTDDEGDADSTATTKSGDGGANYAFSPAQATQSGVYVLTLTTRDHKPVVRHFTFNVDPDEGDLALIKDLAEAGYNHESIHVRGIGTFSGSIDAADDDDWSEEILYLLIVMLLGEQMLAYSATYHTPSKKGTA